MIELKPCPFCGGDAIYETLSFGSNSRSVKIDFHIRCSTCYATHPETRGEISAKMYDDGDLNIYKDDRLATADAWNRRARDDRADQ